MAPQPLNPPLQSYMADVLARGPTDQNTPHSTDSPCTCCMPTKSALHVPHSLGQHASFSDLHHPLALFHRRPHRARARWHAAMGMNIRSVPAPGAARRLRARRHHRQQQLLAAPRVKVQRHACAVASQGLKPRPHCCLVHCRPPHSHHHTQQQTRLLGCSCRLCASRPQTHALA